MAVSSEAGRHQRPAGWHPLLSRLYLAPLLLWLVWDFVPRFFQGDSVSYLSTQIDHWVPPDRSWEFGLFVNFLLRRTHGLTVFMLIQIGVLVVLVEGARLLFPACRAGRAAWALGAFLIALDPLIEIYTRFYMSDFLAMAGFLGATGGLVLALRQESAAGGRAAGLALIILGSFVAVVFRVAYAPIALLTMALAAVLMWRYLTRRGWLILLLAACLPVLAVGAVAGANRVMFARQFPGETFVTKLSGVFLAGVFAPALSEVDFKHAGIPITPQEFKQLDLPNYEKRVMQVWGHEHSDLQQLIKDNLHTSGDYSATVDRAASRLVMSAFRRDPLAFARVYLVGLADFAKPREWRLQVPGEMGLTRTLPDYFLSLVNRYSVLKITPDMTTIRSALIRAYQATAGLYPIQLLLGFLAGVLLLIRSGPKPSVALPFAAFCADLAAAPLYENYLIARYVLAAIFLGYLLIGMAAGSFLRKTPAPE